jgi:SulP family sulfate permease
MDLVLRSNQIVVPTTVIGMLTLVTIVTLLFTPLRRHAFIIAIVMATVVLAALTLPQLPTAAVFGSVTTVGDVAALPSSLPQLAFPRPGLLLAMLLPAFSVAVIGLLQGAGVSQGYPNPDGKYPDVSRDFLGQGAANIATSFVGGIPAGGSISGTALLMTAGARSRLANILAGLLVAAIVMLFAPLVERVPMPALAALLIVAGFQALRVREAVTVWNTGRVPAVVMLLTFLATLIIPLQYAVLIGVALSILLFVLRQSNKVVVTQWVLHPSGFPVERPAPRSLPSHDCTLLQVYGSLYFAAARSLEQLLPDVDDTTGAVAIIGLRGHGQIGSTFVSVLLRYAEALKARDSQLMLIGLDEAARGQLARTGVLHVIGEDNVFLATPQLGEAMNQAVEAARAWLDQASSRSGRPHAAAPDGST